jgi:Pyridoxamine 5'-phosphate oxidase
MKSLSAVLLRFRAPPRPPTERSLATTDADGTPHVRPVWGVWVARCLYFDGHPHTRWARTRARAARQQSPGERRQRSHRRRCRGRHRAHRSGIRSPNRHKLEQQIQQAGTRPCGPRHLPANRSVLAAGAKTSTTALSGHSSDRRLAWASVLSLASDHFLCLGNKTSEIGRDGRAPDLAGSAPPASLNEAEAKDAATDGAAAVSEGGDDAALSRESTLPASADGEFEVVVVTCLVDHHDHVVAAADHDRLADLDVPQAVT